MIIVDDFVMLGKTVPEPCSDGRVFVCSAGYSATLRSLIRVYPLSRYQAPPRWSISTVRLERNPSDSRAESYKLAGDRSPEAHDRINEGFTVTGAVPTGRRAELLKNCVLPSIKAANERIAGYGKDRTSLALLHGSAYALEFDHNPDSPDSPQLALFDSGKPEPRGAKRFAYTPRLRFRDEAGDHRLMLRDWGAFEFLRKQGDHRRSELPAALHLDGSCSLLVGNLTNQRTAWLVISVLRGLRTAPALFDPHEDMAA